MVYKNLNLPATLVHTVNGKEYTINGKLLSINESTKVCTMKFGDRISTNIPLKEVYLNEGLADTLRKAGQKVKAGASAVWNKIVDVIKTVGNFILPVDENGNELYQFINTPVNLAMMNLGPKISVYPSDATKDICDQFGVNYANDTLDDAFATAEDREGAEGNVYFGRVMKDYASTDRTLTESFKYVNENYYNKVNFSDKNALNEAGVYHSIKRQDANGKVVDDYGTNLSGVEIIDRIRTNLLTQLKERTKPIIIWGAPGIGKTAIIKESAKTLKKYGYDFEVISVICSGLLQEDFAIPDTAINKAGLTTAMAVPKTWLPVFDHKQFKGKQLQLVDAYYNSGEYKRNLIKLGFDGSSTDKYDEDGNKVRAFNLEDWEENEKPNLSQNGGIIFFDEFSRLTNEKMTQIMMGILGERMYESMEFASNWVIVLASNRLYDDNKASNDAAFHQIFPPALHKRMTHYTYVPTKSEWLTWARQPGSNGRQHVDEMICAWLERCPDDVWVNGFDIGDDIKVVSTNGTNLTEIFTKIRDNKPLDDNELKIFNTFITNKKEIENCNKQSWDGRIWAEQVMKNINTVLADVFNFDQEMIDECYYTVERTITNAFTGKKETYTAKNIDPRKLSAQLNKIDDDEWNTWAYGKLESISRNDKIYHTTDAKYINRQNANDDSRYKFFMAFIICIFQEHMGANSKPVQYWVDKSSLVDLSDEELKQIVETGHIKGSKDDDLKFEKKFDYRYASQCSWKSNDGTVMANVEKVLNACVEHITFRKVKAEFANILAKLDPEQYEEMRPADVDKILSQYDIVMQTCEVEDGKVVKKDKDVRSLLKEDYDNPDSNKQVYKNIAFMLQNSEAARYMANTCMWLGKLSYQVQSDNCVACAIDAYCMKDNTSKKKTLDSQFISKFLKDIPGIQEYLIEHSTDGLSFLAPATQIVTHVINDKQ